MFTFRKCRWGAYKLSNNQAVKCSNFIRWKKKLILTNSGGLKTLSNDTLKQELDETRAYQETDSDEMFVVNAHLNE